MEEVSEDEEKNIHNPSFSSRNLSGEGFQRLRRGEKLIATAELELDGRNKGGKGRRRGTRKAGSELKRESNSLIALVGFAFSPFPARQRGKKRLQLRQLHPCGDEPLSHPAEPREPHEIDQMLLAALKGGFSKDRAFLRRRSTKSLPKLAAEPAAAAAEAKRGRAKEQARAE